MKPNLRQSSSGADQAFHSGLGALRARANVDNMKGAVTPRFPEADRKLIVELLNTTLAKFVAAEFSSMPTRSRSMRIRSPSASPSRVIVK